MCPGLGVPAFPHGLSTKLNQACSYTFLWNNFHFPAGTVPVTTVRDDEQHYSSGFSDTLSANAKAAAAGSAGLPVGVQVGGSAHRAHRAPLPTALPPAGAQVVALPWQDERCLEAMAALEAALPADARRRATTPPGLFD